MAKSKANEEYMKNVKEIEKKQLESIDRKLKHLGEEAILKAKMDFTPTEPKFAFEKDKAWIAHIQKASVLTVEDQILLLQEQKMKLMYNIANRIELEERSE